MFQQVVHIVTTGLEWLISELIGRKSELRKSVNSEHTATTRIYNSRMPNTVRGFGLNRTLHPN
jgi:hypothetical protein